MIMQLLIIDNDGINLRIGYSINRKGLGNILAK